MFFFFNDTATTEIYTLSLHDALPIYSRRWNRRAADLRLGNAQLAFRARRNHSRSSAFGNSAGGDIARRRTPVATVLDRKSTRLNSSHSQISYAVFCLKKKKHDSQRWHHARHTAAALHDRVRDPIPSTSSQHDHAHCTISHPHINQSHPTPHRSFDQQP